MTVKDAIDMADRDHPNAYAFSDKLRWLSRLDNDLKVKIIDTHEDPVIPYDTVIDYANDSDHFDTTQLIAQAPFDEMYLFYIAAQVDLLNGEYERYNNSNTMFLTAYTDYERWYNRTHTPKQPASNSYF